MFTRVKQPMLLLRCDAVCGEGVREGTVLLAPLFVGFQSFPNYPQSNWALLVLIPEEVGLYILGPCGSLQWTLLWVWESLPLLPQPPQAFSVRSFEALFLCAGALGCGVCLAPQLFLPVYLHSIVGPPSTEVAASPAPPATALPQVLSIWLPISTPPPGLDECFFFNSLVVGFHTVQLSVSSGCFLFLNLLLSFLWLCEEAQYVYLCLHLGQKSVCDFEVMCRNQQNQHHLETC